MIICTDKRNREHIYTIHSNICRSSSLRKSKSLGQAHTHQIKKADWKLVYNLPRSRSRDFRFSVWPQLKPVSQHSSAELYNSRVMRFLLLLLPLLGISLNRAMADDNCDTEFYQTEQGAVCGAVETTDGGTAYSAFYGEWWLWWPWWLREDWEIFKSNSRGPGGPNNKHCRCSNELFF